MRRLGLFLILVGCHQRTELMIGVATDIKAPDIVDEVDLVVMRTSDGFPEESLQWNLTGVEDQPFNLPGSYGIFSDDIQVQVELDLTGLKAGHPVVTRHAILSLVPDQTLFYRMGITAGCETMQDCGGPGMTCIEGQCKDVHLDSSQFPQFTDELVTNLTCNSGVTYIDTGTNTPMTFTADAAQCPANLCSEGTCLVPPNGQGCPSPLVMCNGQCLTSCGVKDGGVPMGDGGGTGGGCIPNNMHTYQIQRTCSGTICNPSYPDVTANITVDMNGNGDYAKSNFAGIDGTCNASFQPGTCTANINCNLTSGAAGVVTGTVNYTGLSASGNLRYTINSPNPCDEQCTVMLQ